MSFIHPQSHQLRTAKVLTVFFAVFQQSRKLYHSPKISIFAQASGPIEARQFFISKPGPGVNPTRSEKSEPDWTTLLCNVFVCPKSVAALVSKRCNVENERPHKSEMIPAFPPLRSPEILMFYPLCHQI